jgi:hypothetical protein
MRHRASRPLSDRRAVYSVGTRTTHATTLWRARFVSTVSSLDMSVARNAFQKSPTECCIHESISVVSTSMRWNGNVREYPP